MVFIPDEAIDNFVNLFQLLYQKAKKFPQSIITDQQITIIVALEKIRNQDDGKFPNFCNLLDQYYIMKSVQKQLAKKAG
jgi:hypothetical protein